MDNKHKEKQEILVSIVIPVFNELKVLDSLTEALEDTLKAYQFEIIYVNDGSNDGSEQLLDSLASNKPYVRVLHLARNFGQTAAVLAGLNYGMGDVFVVMDSDMQDDPASIPKFLDKWHEGFNIVYALRIKRKENIIKVFLFSFFYRILNYLSSIHIPFDAGNFGLIDARAARQIIQFQEYDRFYPGLRSWIGFRQIGIEVERNYRYDRQPRTSLMALFSLAKTAIFSFSALPLLLFYWLSAVSLLIFGSFFTFALYQKFVTGLSVPGWTSTIIIACFFGSINFLGIAILGEYIIRIYNQVRARPTFIIERIVNEAESDISKQGEFSRGSFYRNDKNLAVIK